jgi:hypothetical protein
MKLNPSKGTTTGNARNEKLGTNKTNTIDKI